ncbi:class I SAM-dependent methyltransferase [Pseudooceanicola aestuarii]|uniref:class I SAM-dependent methyltransferase n=1 Tax=Pseudooceanicola aestuarii TaxID=2697319 RepID=UPI0013D53545|nr:methyltransferase [Pseudooceanicola aestuarii]
MVSQRLRLALEGGLILPDGRIGLFAPRADADLSALPADVTIVTGDAPVHDQLQRRGMDVAVTAQGDFAAIVVCLPRAKAEARALIAQAAALSGGPVIVDGQKEDGADALLRECRKRVPVEGPINKAHGKLFWFDAAPGVFADWAAPDRQQVAGGFVTAPGVFSADGIDPASALLGDALPEGLKGRAVDLGGGWGYLTHRLLAQEKITHVDLVESDHAAVEAARINLPDPRVAFHWADARQWRPERGADLVIMNPPFHTARSADPELGRAFIRSAAACLSPSGRLFMVANRHLGYEKTLDEVFGEWSELGGDGKFKLFEAARPRRSAGRKRG